MSNIVKMYLCQFCNVPVRKPEVTHDGLPSHANCLFAHITARSYIARLQRNSKLATAFVAKLTRR